MQQVCTIDDQNATPGTHQSRQQISRIVGAFENTAKPFGTSQRDFAEMVGIPRSTLQGQIARKASIDAPPATVEFLESSEGMDLLHRVVLAAQTVITQINPGGIRSVCTFLELSGLDRFVASSYGSQQKAIAELEHQLGHFGDQQTQQLGQQMQPKKITIVEDETFHPETCLVAMEAASGFILLEEYAHGRDCETWSQQLAAAVGDLPVEIVQATSDEGSGLLKHARTDLKAHHSPDLFHLQQELVWGTSRSMASRVTQAEAAVDQAHKRTSALEHRYDVDEGSEKKRSSRLPPLMRQLVEETREAEELAHAHLEETEEKREQMSEAIRDISKDYHPFDLKTGAARGPEQVEHDLEEHFESIEQIGRWAGLSQACFARIAKARRLLPALVATITFFHDTIITWVGDLGLSEELERFVLEQWIPGRYLELVAGRAQSADERSRLTEAAAAVMPSVEQIESWLGALCRADRQLVMYVVEQCAQLFQRSSSGVEGRNGHLSLFHHGHHRLTSRKLKALTVIHNFLKKRPDGTTAAQRFFGRPAQDVFEWLVTVTPYPARPRKKRSRAES